MLKWLLWTISDELFVSFRKSFCKLWILLFVHRFSEVKTITYIIIAKYVVSNHSIAALLFYHSFISLLTILKLNKVHCQFICSLSFLIGLQIWKPRCLKLTEVIWRYILPIVFFNDSIFEQNPIFKVLSPIYSLCHDVEVFIHPIFINVEPLLFIKGL